MSMSTEIDYGYGIDLTEFDFEDEAVAKRLLDYLEAHMPEQFDKIVQDAKDWDVDVVDMLTDFAEPDSNICHYLAYIMTKKYEIDITYCVGTDEGMALMFLNRLPWQMTERERNMTEYGLTQVFSEFGDILGLEWVADFQQVEYWC